MINFKSKIQENEIIPGQKLEEYIKDLYKDNDFVDLNKIQLQNKTITPISIEDMEWAISKLCRDKAKGVDQM